MMFFARNEKSNNKAFRHQPKPVASSGMEIHSGKPNRKKKKKRCLGWGNRDSSQPETRRGKQTESEYGRCQRHRQR